MGCLDWNQHLLASGGREGAILLHDVRWSGGKFFPGMCRVTNDDFCRVAEHQVGRLTGHTQEVCGLGKPPQILFHSFAKNSKSVQ